MRFNELEEGSPLTFKGSLTPDLLKSKLWLCQSLKTIGRTKFSTIYILGSWYGNMAVVLNKCRISFDKIINVDIDKKHIVNSQRLLSAMGINVQSMNRDANKLNYKQVDKNSLVINTSVNEIEDHGWFDKIPDGTLVALQSRNNLDSDYCTTLEKLNQEFFLNDTLVLDQINLEDPETKYQRFMKIGVK